MAATSDFPTFADGDVHIIVSGARQYRLHSTILRGASETFRDLLDEDYAAKLSKRALRRGTTARFRLVLQPRGWVGLGGAEQFIFCRHDLNDEGVPINHPNTIPLDLENGMPPNPSHLAYNAVLGAFYNKPIDFGGFRENDVSNMLHIAIYIADAAQTLQCMHIVNKPIEATLLTQRQQIFRAIANQPLQWLVYADLIRSRAIFREALIFATGKFNTLEVRAQMEQELSTHPHIMRLLVEKATELKNNVKDAFSKCCLYYPPHIQRVVVNTAGVKENIGRESYSSDIFTWIAMTAVRHWLTQQINGDETHNAPDMGYTVLEWMVQGGDAYLSATDLHAFHGNFPMTDKGRSILSRNVADFKEEWRKRVKHLWSDESSLDRKSRNEYKYLTCVTVRSTDYPWEGETTEDTESSSGTIDTQEDDKDAGEDEDLEEDEDFEDDNEGE